MKLADIVASAVESTPSLEIDVETLDGREYAATFRNFLLLTEAERAATVALGAEEAAKKPAGRGKKAEEAGFVDPLTKRAEDAKRGLALVLRPIEGVDVMADLEAVFSLDPETRDLAWITFESKWAEATQVGEAVPSQKS